MGIEMEQKLVKENYEKDELKKKEAEVAEVEEEDDEGGGMEEVVQVSVST